MSFAFRPKASAIAATFSATGFVRSMRSRARGPTAIRRMYMSGSRSSEPGGPTASIDIAPVPPRATTPRPSSGSTARSKASPPAPTAGPSSARRRRRGRSRPCRDRQLRETGEHRHLRRLLGGVLVVPAEPARAASAAHSVARAKRAQGQVSSGVSLTSARSSLDAARGALGPLEHEVHHRAIASSCFSFSITGTSFRYARSSTYSWIIRISGMPAM